MDLINNVKSQHGSNGKVHSGTHACSQMNCSRNRRTPCIYITGKYPAFFVQGGSGSGFLLDFFS